MNSKYKIESLAHDTVQKSGLRGLSFRTIGAQVGVKSSSVHYHFPEKSDLAEALINRFRNEHSKSLRDISEQNLTAHTSIKQFSQIFIELCKQNKMCFAGMMASETESLTPANRENLASVFDGVNAWLVHEFERGVDELNTDLPAATLAKVLLASLEGALLIDRVQSSDNHLSAINMLIDSWFRGTGLSNVH